MYKKLLLSAISIALSSAACAGQYYIGPGLSYDNITASHRHYQGMSPRLTWGYADISGRSYMAGEFFGSIGSIQFNNSHRDKAGLKMMNSVGFGFMPGYVFTGSLVGYVRAGYVFSYFVNARQHWSGFQGGLGIQGDVLPNWLLRGEYDYTGYSTPRLLGSPNNNQLVISMIFKLP